MDSLPFSDLFKSIFLKYLKLKNYYYYLSLIVMKNYLSFNALDFDRTALLLLFTLVKLLEDESCKFDFELLFAFATLLGTTALELDLCSFAF